MVCEKRWVVLRHQRRTRYGCSRKAYWLRTKWEARSMYVLNSLPCDVYPVKGMMSRGTSVCNLWLARPVDHMEL